jgi:hypothetical protein
MPNGQRVTIGERVHVPLFPGVNVGRATILALVAGTSHPWDDYTIYPGGVRVFSVEQWAEIRGKRPWQIREQCRAIIARRARSGRGRDGRFRWYQLATLHRQLFGSEGRVIAGEWRDLKVRR